MSHTPKADGRPYRRNRKRVLDACDICWLCGHPGADTADHVIPRSLGGDVKDIANLRPAHGVSGCPTCGKRCNSARGNGLNHKESTVKRSRDW